jgi:hypothetical protein
MLISPEAGRGPHHPRPEKMLKIPRKTQMDLRAKGGFIPHFRAGHEVLYRREAVLRWIDEQESKATGDADGCP